MLQTLMLDLLLTFVDLKNIGLVGFELDLSQMLHPSSVLSAQSIHHFPQLFYLLCQSNGAWDFTQPALFLHYFHLQLFLVLQHSLVLRRSLRCLRAVAAALGFEESDDGEFGVFEVIFFDHGFKIIMKF